MHILSPLKSVISVVKEIRRITKTWLTKTHWT